MSSEQIVWGNDQDEYHKLISHAILILQLHSQNETFRITSILSYPRQQEENEEVAAAVSWKGVPRGRIVAKSPVVVEKASYHRSSRMRVTRVTRRVSKHGGERTLYPKEPAQLQERIIQLLKTVLQPCIQIELAAAQDILQYQQISLQVHRFQEPRTSPTTHQPSMPLTQPLALSLSLKPKPIPATAARNLTAATLTSFSHANLASAKPPSPPPRKPAMDPSALNQKVLALRERELARKQQAESLKKAPPSSPTAKQTASAKQVDSMKRKAPERSSSWMALADDG